MTGGPHLSRFAIDALLVDERAAGDAAGHAASCAECRARVDAARRELAVLRPHRPTRRGAGPRGGTARKWLLVPVVAVAATLLLVVRVRPQPSPDASPGVLGIKGGPAVRIVAQHDGRTFSLEDGARLRGGDALRVLVEPAGYEQILVASVDGAGKATVYVPFDGSSSQRIDSTQPFSSPSVVLDGTPGPERLFVLLAHAPIAAAPVVAALRAIGHGGPDVVRRTRSLGPPGPGLIEWTIAFEDGPPPP